MPGPRKPVVDNVEVTLGPALVLVAFLAVSLIVGSAAVVIMRDSPARLSVRVEGLPGYLYYEREYDIAIAYENQGRSVAESARLEAQLPSGFSQVGLASGASLDGQRLVWQLGDLAPGERGEVLLTLRGRGPEDLSDAVYDLPGYEGQPAFIDRFELVVSLNGGVSTASALAMADTGMQPMVSLDLGDAPDPTYVTLLASGGPSHTITSLTLGALADSEADGQPNATATGDDIAGAADEDGVTFPLPLVAGTTTIVSVAASAAGTLDYFFDFDGNGTFGNVASEVFTFPHPGGVTIAVPVTIPAGAVVGGTFARFG